MPESAAVPGRQIFWLRKYLLLLGAAVRAQFQYRANVLMVMVGGALYQGVGLAFIWAVTARFGSIGGWSLAEIAFLYGIRLTGHGVWIVFMSQLIALEPVIQQGEFDRYLLRPVGPLTQLMTRQFSIGNVSDLISGPALLLFAARRLPIHWSPGVICFLVIAIIGGAMTIGSYQLAIAAFTFRTLSTRVLRIKVDDFFTTFGGYPLKIFPPATRFMLTFAVPLAFVAYLPAAALLNRASELDFSPWIAWTAPLVGPVLLLTAHRLWCYQLRHYSSSGT